ncbi:hypothetical protein [Cupriavidus consociatus]|uniref:hypothetical protein n=1 Tax=Cupriavidus consociatus TaxID=2821357 RepID=UPI001AE1620C|nr:MULTISPECIES: hypothetical protein [unclassified Cupriavidus]MBP0624009.1 hypothetical protein [Cupriavidus sp. LEh25]MDK2660718.1 hypothetical protein [Cupriavidus sp. LEh21]
MKLKKLPSTFCWSKMGTESGEDLSSILLRKEWERQLGNGQFLWGIGQSLGENADLATADGAPLVAVFSPMPSRPKSIDVDPGEVVLWTAWIDGAGEARPLPRHAFVTSRATLPSGRRKESHYALVCSSQSVLQPIPELSISPATLRNLGTGKALGASQVTAVVSHDHHTEPGTKQYPVSFTVLLEAPYCVRLANPVTLKSVDVRALEDAARSGSIDRWATVVTQLRQPVQMPKPRGRTIDMFAPEPSNLDAAGIDRALAYA